MPKMLTAIRSGVVEMNDGTLNEIVADQTRISPEVLRHEPQYADYFEPDVAARGAFSEVRTETRTTGPDGTVIGY